MKINLTKYSKIFLIALLIFSTSCTSKLGDFTVISNQNVRGLEHKGVNRNEIQPTTAKSCTHRVYLTRFAVGAVTLGIGWFIPALDLVIGESERDRMESAVDLAIKEGKKSVFDADIIQNAVIKEKNIIIPVIYGYKCIVVEGDVVSSVTRASAKAN